jgi:threonine/homoserine efflux transporter RhtA
MMEMPDFLKDETTRSILTWLGTGVATIVGAIWAVYKFRGSKAKLDFNPSVSAAAFLQGATFVTPKLMRGPTASNNHNVQFHW